jgi:non-specific serine/threonine protein kinase
MRAKLLHATGAHANALADYATAKQYQLESLQIARALNDPNLVAAALQGLGIITERSSSSRAEAEAYYHEALELYRQLNRPERQAVSLFNLCSLAQKYEDYAAMQRMASDAVALGRATRSDYILSRALTALGDALVANGQPLVATPLLREALELGRSMTSPHVVGLARIGLGNAAMTCGDLKLARGYYADALASFRTAANQPRMIEAVESFGALAAREGDFARASRLIAAAAAARKRIDAVRPPRVARLLAGVERSCIAALGEATSSAHVTAGAALSIDEACDLALVASPVASDTVLSAREFEIAVLIGEGLTNPQIAARLIISARTVQTHVTHILFKLGVASRSQVAAWVARNTLRKMADTATLDNGLG